MIYQPRLVDADIQRALRVAGAVVITGPRACGKTMTARQHSQAELRLDTSGPDLARAAIDPDAALNTPTPLLIDEWQNLPAIWDAARRQVDERQSRGQFIITGSAWPQDDAGRHTGAGRFSTVKMRPMSLAESGQSSGRVTLTALFQGTVDPNASTDASVADHARWIARGGWPGALDLDDEDAAEGVQDYLSTLVEREFPAVGGARRSPAQLLAFLRGYAGVQAHPATMAAIGRRVGDDMDAVSRNFASDFHRFAERMFLIEDLPAWSASLRSRTPLVQLPKRYFVDPSLACAALGVTADRLLNDVETLGYLFEALVVRDLRCYAQASRLRGVYHLRDQKGRDEIDVILEDRAGQWVGIEVKLGYSQVQAAAENLARVAASVTHPPAALAVIVPTGRVARTVAGVWVIPLTVLGA